MTDRHPEPRLLGLFMRGELAAEESKDIVIHLLSGCEPCRRIARESFPCNDGEDRRVTSLQNRWQRKTSVEYAQVFDRVMPAVWEAEGELAQQGEVAPALLAELERHPHQRRLLLVRNSRRFRNWRLCELIIDRAHSEGLHDPSSAVDFGRLAVTISKDLGSRDREIELLEDLRCRAHSILGNALRISGELADATEEFRVAEECLDRGTGETLERARFLELKSYVAGETRKFALALEMLDEAIAAYRSGGEYHRLGRTLIIKGHHLGEKGDLPGAVGCLRQGLRHIDQAREPRLVLVGKHNLVRHLFQAGRYHQALAMLPETRRLHQELGSEIDLVRFNWLEGMILRDSNDLEAAERVLIKVKKFFVDSEIAHDSALVSLDLAAIYLRQQRTVELKQIATEMLTIFRALRINREAIAALVLFQKAVEFERVSLGLVRDLAAYLKTSRHEANLPFRPSSTS